MEKKKLKVGILGCRAGRPSACQVLLGELLGDRERDPEDRYLRGDGREGEAVGQVAEEVVGGVHALL